MRSRRLTPSPRHIMTNNKRGFEPATKPHRAQRFLRRWESDVIGLRVSGWLLGATSPRAGRVPSRGKPEPLRALFSRRRGSRKQKEIRKPYDEYQILLSPCFGCQEIKQRGWLTAHPTQQLQALQDSHSTGRAGPPGLAVPCCYPRCPFSSSTEMLVVP